jgi:hypothetical protein
MAKLRRDEAYQVPLPKSLRIVASGTLFVTHTLFVPSYPAPSTEVRAHSVEKARGGGANTVRTYHVVRIESHPYVKDSLSASTIPSS